MDLLHDQHILAWGGYRVTTPIGGSWNEHVGRE